MKIKHFSQNVAIHIYIRGCNNIHWLVRSEPNGNIAEIEAGAKENIVDRESERMPTIP